MQYIIHCALFILLFADVLHATPIIHEKYVNYKITGHSADALRQQMSMLGPTDIGREHFDASTHWFIQWHYRYQPVASGCVLTKVKVSVDITYQFPDWLDYAASNDDLKNRWKTYMHYLQVHEKGHAENGLQAAITIEQALKKLPAMQSCQVLAETADTIAYQTIAKHNTIDINYEYSTNHGATQGATFP